MMIFFKVQASVAALLLCAAGHAPALELQHQNFGDDEIFTAVVNTFKKPLMHRFNPAAPAGRKPLLVLGPTLKFGKKMTSQSLTDLTRQELVARQQAVFFW